MNNTKLKTASSLSADSSQVRYQKAVKQITKLVNVNNQLRAQIAKNQQIVKQYHTNMDMKNSELNRMFDEKIKAQEQLMQVLDEKNILSKENQQLKKQVHKLRSHKNNHDSHTRKKQSRDTDYQSERLAESEKLILQLERMLEVSQVTIKQMDKKLKLYENVTNLNGRSSKNMYTQNIKQSLNSNQLNKKLTVANDFIGKINQQNVELKQRLYKAQSKNKLLSVKSMEVLNKHTPQLSPRNSLFNSEVTRNSQEVLKRLHKLEEQSKKNHKEMKQIKAFNNQLEGQNNQLKKQNSRLKSQVNGFQNLIQKQQEIISNLYQSYETDINKMTEQFKQKLLQQRENFSPAKSADHLKTIQSLQVQNKNLKKKFQLCSIQLTKCFKTLEVYKAKLSECEKDYEKIFGQRQQLIERLSRLQSSHRQKSIHSRGSASRIFVDNDRRNSMGQTGYFNYN